MPTSDINMQQQPYANCESDYSSTSTSKSLFNQSTCQKDFLQPVHQRSNQISATPSNTNISDDKQTDALLSRIRFLEDQINLQAKTLTDQQSNIIDLNKVLLKIFDQIDHITSIIINTPSCPAVSSRPTSIHDDMTKCAAHAYVNSNNCDARNGLQSDPLITPSQTVNNSSAVSSLSPHNSRTLTYAPIVEPAISQPINSSTNTFKSTPLFLFNISLADSLPKFSGKIYEMPIKFITQFQLCVTNLFGSNEQYLLGTIQQCLFDNALTWYILVNQEQSINSWAQFKTLFICRFREPVKIEYLRDQLRSMWQADDESSVDFYERIKMLISEIDPQASPDYIKRKFLEKLRKDFHDTYVLNIFTIFIFLYFHY